MTDTAEIKALDNVREKLAEVREQYSQNKPLVTNLYVHYQAKAKDRRSKLSPEAKEKTQERILNLVNQGDSFGHSFAIIEIYTNDFLGEKRREKLSPEQVKKNYETVFETTEDMVSDNSKRGYINYIQKNITMANRGEFLFKNSKSEKQLIKDLKTQLPPQLEKANELVESLKELYKVVAPIYGLQGEFVQPKPKLQEQLGVPSPAAQNQGLQQE